MIHAPEFDIEDVGSLEEAISLFQNSRADLSDLLILTNARRERALPVYSFDEKFARHEGVSLLS